MDAATIEQTNKIRQSLGLIPLPIPGATASGAIFKEHTSSESSDEEAASTLETREAASYQNYKEVQDELSAKKQREAKAAAIKRARDSARRFTKLEGRGLGDADEDADVDARTWLKNHNRRQKLIEKERARRLEEELAEREKLAGVEYGAGDLAGVRVAHSLDTIEEGEQVLTLKDTTIDENEEEGDELENVDILEREKLNEKLDSKKRRPVYDPNASSEDAGVLPQYTEEIEGKKRKRFTLDGQGATLEEREAKRRIGEKLQAQPISLDILKEEPKSDYMDVSQIKIKKPKKPKKSTRHRSSEAARGMSSELADGHANSAADGEAMEVEQAVSATSVSQSHQFDDDHLQSALARQRTAALNKRRKLKRPEDIARELQDDAEASPMDALDDLPGLILNESSEFVSRLRRLSSAEPDFKPALSPPSKASRALSEDGDGQVRLESLEEQPSQQHQPSRDSVTTNEIGLEEESTIDAGMAATLGLLRSRGILKSTEGDDAVMRNRQRALFMQEKRRRELEAEQQARSQRQQHRTAGTYDKFSARDRENARAWENKQRDDQVGRQMAQFYDQNYKPSIELKYVDEHKRSVGQKDAFRLLSHSFHGRDSGPAKREAQLKRIANEERREAFSLLDANQSQTGMNQAAGTTARKNKQAGVRLA